MSTFYVLPPKSFLGACFAGYLKPLFPGLPWTDAACADLAGALAAAVCRQPDIYVVYREELPEGESTARALADGFGAEPDDEVVEIAAGNRLGELTARRWRLAEAA
jgi:hypothetical protein